MDDDMFGFFLILMFAAMMMLAVGGMAYDGGQDSGAEAVYVEAMEKGFAERIVDQQTGETSWKWKND